MGENLINVVHFARFIVLEHHSIPNISGVGVKRNGIISGSIWGSFQGWGSFRGLYRSHTADSNLIVLAPVFMEGMGSVLRNFEEKWITLVSAVLQIRKFLE